MLRQCVLAACVLAAGSVGGAAFAACSSFSATDGPVGADAAGSDGAPAIDGSVVDAPVSPPCAAGDTSCDPLNCGRASHSCLGGACIASTCQPILMGTSAGETIIDVAVDAQRVVWLTSNRFWNDPGHVYACPRAGCAGAPPTSLTGASPVSTGSLAGDGNKAYFSVPYGSPRVMQILPNGSPQMIGAAHAEAVRLQVRSGSLYFVTLYEGAPAGAYTGHVYRWDGMTEALVGGFLSTHNLNDLVVIGDRAFWSGAEFLGTCTLGTASDCMSPTEFTVTTGEYGSLTTDGASVLWTDGTQVLSCLAQPTTCATPTVVVAPPNLTSGVRSLAFDHGILYVSTVGNDIFGCSLTDCAGTLKLIAHETRLFQQGEYAVGHTVAADDTAVYWSAVDGTEVPDGDGGLDAHALVHRVMKLAK
ncbi:MAG: putative serine/threonine-protein kinase pknH [Myxococcaceae bacterium]|nr:putative serine/threonine-protein kinase pknH [Myxococcaceae bacterium]